MNRNEFEMLYVHNHHFSLTHAQATAAERMRTDWNTFDRICNFSDPAKTISTKDAAEDIAQFFFLLQYAYIGYEYYSSICDFEKLCHKLCSAKSSCGNNFDIWHYCCGIRAVTSIS